MGVYTNTDLLNETFNTDMINDIAEQYLTDELLRRVPTDELREWCESTDAAALCEAGVFRRNTLVKLSKNDDFSRRKTLNVINIAKKKNDPLYAKAMKYKALYRECLVDMEKKYNSQAQVVAKSAQKEYMKKTKGGKFPISFIKAGGSDRTGEDSL